MSRQRKNKLFDLFKSAFKISFFYKPSGEDDDVFYYLILDEIVRLKIKEIKGVYVIDDVIPLTSSYLKPVYEKIVKHIMSQEKVTVLVSLTGDAISIQQACIANNAPLKSDERYITVSKLYYAKLKATYGDDISKYGFYILSVSDEEPESEPEKKPIVVNAKSSQQIPNNKPTITPIGEEPVIMKIGNMLTEELGNLFRGAYTEEVTENSIRCYIAPEESFVIEYTNDGIYIKDLLQKKSSGDMNLVVLKMFIEILEHLTKFHKNVYIINVQNWNLSGLCNAKGYHCIQEAQKLPLNNLFHQAFHGYGTFQIVI